MVRKYSRRSTKGEKLARVIFITGTDTGVGKTLLTALLLDYFRSQGLRAFALKPFCSGNLKDVNLLSRLQDGELSREEIAPFCFTEPIAPLAAARSRRVCISSVDVLERIHAIQTRCECLLVEGAGGLMVPLAEDLLVADLIAALDCYVVVVAQNKLGVINHTLLTSKVLALYGVTRSKIVLMEVGKRDLSANTNGAILAELMAPMNVIGVPFLGVRANRPAAVRRGSKYLEKTLALISDFGSFCPLSGKQLSCQK